MVCEDIPTGYDSISDFDLTSMLVGTLPAGFDDPLQQDGLSAFTQGLRVHTCQPTPSLGTVPPAPPSSSTSSTLPSCPPTTLPSTTPPSTTPPPSTTTPPAQCSATTSTVVITVTVTQTLRPSPSTPPNGGGGGGSGDKVCIAGTGSNNYMGLCSFCCNYDYCPPGPCTCTEYGDPVPPPPSTGARGAPLVGEDDSYLGLCSFACNHGYCPPTACRVV